MKKTKNRVKKVLGKMNKNCCCSKKSKSHMVQKKDKYWVEVV